MWDMYDRYGMVEYGGFSISDDAQNVLNLGNYGYESMILQPLLLILLKEGSDDFERYRPNFHS